MSDELIQVCVYIKKHVFTFEVRRIHSGYTFYASFIFPFRGIQEKL